MIIVIGVSGFRDSFLHLDLENFATVGVLVLSTKLVDS